MNASVPLCRVCRRPRALIIASKRATFISLSKRKPPPQPNPNHFNPDTNDSTLNPDIRDAPNSPNEVVRLPLRYPKRKPRTIKQSPGDLLESLFEQSLTPPKPLADPSPPPASELKQYENATTLKGMLKEHNTIGAWHFFCEHFGPIVGGSENIRQRPLPNFLQVMAIELFEQLLHTYSLNDHSPAFPTMTDISALYTRLGLLNGIKWAGMMLLLLNTIVKNRQVSIQDTTLEKLLLLDLLGAWNVVCRDDITNLPPIDLSHLDWSKAPQISSQDAVKTCKRSSRGIHGSFGLLTPSFKIKHLDNIATAGIATCILLTQKTGIDEESILHQADSFLSTLRQVVAICPNDIGELLPSNARHNLLKEFILKEWPQLERNWEPVHSIPPESSQGPSRHSVVEKPALHGTLRTSLFDRIKTALKAGDASQIDVLWSTAMQLPISRDEVTGTRSPISASLTPGLCNYFVVAYMTLRLPNKAIDVWNFMISSSLNPTAATWTSMLQGCKDSRDVKALEAIWNKMLASDVKPDKVCWTTRINGLAECGREQLAVKALDQMGRQWLVAVKRKNGKINVSELHKLGDLDSAVKPSIEMVNAVISILLKKRNSELAYKVLTWASKYGINPDVITYNILLRPLIRDGHSNEAQALLQQMEKAGIQADVATFTTTIDDVFSSLDSNTPGQQKAMIFAMLSEMEDAGIKANHHTYGKLIYQLLRKSKGDLTAVNAMFERMASHGLRPSAHIYTILIEHYFSQGPSGLGAVRSLIERARMESGTTDKIFWDRAIEGYARAGETASAMRILGKVTSENNNNTGWYTLSTVLTALAENQEWESARSLVRDIRVDRGGPLPDDVRGVEGQHQFWRLATELKLIDEV